MAESAKENVLAFKQSGDLKETHEVVSKRLLEVFQSVNENSVSKEVSHANNPLVLKTINKLKKVKKDELSSHDLKVLNKRFMSGHLPRSKPVDDDNDESEDDGDDESKTVYYATDKSTTIKKVIKVQINFLLAIRNYALKYASRYGNSWLKTVIPTNQIATLITFLLYTYILNAEFLLYFLPLFFFVSSLVVMIVSTLRLLRGEKRFKEFMAWSELLGSVDSTLNVAEAEDNYFKKHLSPLISLPPAVILNVMAFSVASIRFLPLSELALSSLGLSVASFYSFYCHFDKSSLYAMGLHLIASLLEGFQRLSSDPNGFLSFSFASLGEFRLNFSLPVVIRLASFILILATPFRSRFRTKWVGVVRGVAPILYVLLWWEMFTMFFLDSSFAGLFRAGLGIVVLFCSIPLSILLLAFAIIRWLLVFQFLKISLLTLALVLPLVFFYNIRPQNNLAQSLIRVNSSFGPALKILVGVVLFTLVFTLVVFYRPSGLQVQNSNLTWMNYGEICLKNDENKIYSRRLCHQLSGYHINWTGTVKDVEIINIDNKFESVLRVLPSSFSNWLSCLYGEKFEEESCPVHPNTYEPRSCFEKRSFLRECHLDYYNKYQFAVVVQHGNDFDSLRVKVIAGNRFKALIFLLHPEARINYKGELLANKGIVELHHLKILDKHINKPPRHMAEFDVSASMHDSFSALVRFFFSPLVTLTPDSEDAE